MSVDSEVGMDRQIGQGVKFRLAYFCRKEDFDIVTNLCCVSYTILGKWVDLEKYQVKCKYYAKLERQKMTNLKCNGVRRCNVH